MEFSQWTFLDVIFALVILVSTGFALMKGLVREITSIVALVAGFVLAALYYRAPGDFLRRFMKSEAMADLLGFLMIFLGCILLGALVAYLINRFVKMASLEWADRLMGGLFGLVRGWLVCSIIVLAMVAFPVGSSLVARSFLAPYLLAGARAAVLMVPDDLRNKFDQEYKKVVSILNEKGGRM
jgi:membrane protein required for colicin V production